MNPEAQRIAIAEACGWTKVHWYEDNAGPNQCVGPAHVAQYKCRKCGLESEWQTAETISEIRRGIPCPKCNPTACPKCGNLGVFIRERPFADGSGKVYMCDTNGCANQRLYFYPPNKKLCLPADSEAGARDKESNGN